jgi:hypothetical protein
MADGATPWATGRRSLDRRRQDIRAGQIGLVSPQTTLLPARSATDFCTKYIATSVTIVVVTTT